MKTSLLAPALLLIPVLAAAQQQYVIKGKIGNLNAPAKVFLRYSLDGKAVQDSAQPVNGAFEFKGNLPYPVKGSLTVNYGTFPQRGLTQADIISVYLEKGTIHATSKDSIQHTVVKGPKLNTDLKALESALKPINDRQQELFKTHYAKSPEARKEKATEEAFNAAYKAISAEQKAAYKAFALSHLQSQVGLDALRSYGGATPDFEEVEPLFAKFSDDVRKSAEGIRYQERLQRLKALVIGATAPDFQQNDVEGNPVTLNSFRGKYVLIDFWASWCGPCRAENPAVVKAYNEYKDKNFTILGVSLDQENGREKWIKAIQDDNLTWTQVSDLAYWKNQVAQLYAVNAIPQNFLIDPSGKIIAKNLRGEALREKLAEVIQ